ncbi:MAG: peptidase [Halolamina sp.]
MTVLVTGYEPFGDHEANPTESIAGDLDGTTVAGHDVVGAVLPVAFDEVAAELTALLDAHDPEAVVATGVAGGRQAVAVERVGVNVADCAGVPDNDGAEPRGVHPADGPDAYLSTLPVGETVRACLDAGVPARVSNTAGTHCCNRALYALLHALDRRNRDVPAGFVHVPLTPGRAAAETDPDAAASAGSVPPSLPLSASRRAVEVAFETALSA